jgi:hypothetical protein
VSRLGTFTVDKNKSRIAPFLSYRAPLAEAARFEEEIETHYKKVNGK